MVCANVARDRVAQRRSDMEELGLGRESVGQTLDDRTPVAWRDLRDWLKLVEQAGQLKRIDAPVDPDEELGAITFMAGGRSEGRRGGARTAARTHSERRGRAH